MSWLGTARLGTYVAGAVSAAAMAAAMMGWGTYDPATNTFDLGPIDLTALVAVLTSGISSLVAAIAYAANWRRRDD